MELDYELIPGSRNDVTNIEFTILKNRGIENPKEYLSLKSDCLIPYQDLENIDVAVSCLLGHLDDEIHVVVDCDVDGYTSAAMLISYLKDQKKDISLSIWFALGICVCLTKTTLHTGPCQTDTTLKKCLESLSGILIGLPFRENALPPMYKATSTKLRFRIYMCLISSLQKGV